jgi:two-component system NtrC family sensor kinase
MSTNHLTRPSEDEKSAESLPNAASTTPAANRGKNDEAVPLRELGYLSSAVGHHVINAFSAIVSNAELLRSRAKTGLDPAELDLMASSIVATALDASHVARRLIDRARSVTSVEANAVGPEPSMVDLNRVVTETIESERRAHGEGVHYLPNLNPVPLIAGDAAQLRSMLGHILQNARESMPAGSGVVALSTSTDPRNWVFLTIRDSGCGMVPEVLKQAAEPFFTTKPERWGVGLTIAHGIWRRHRGALSIESHPGLGTTIRLSIGPITAGRQVDPMPPPASAHSVQAEPPPQGAG